MGNNETKNQSIADLEPLHQKFKKVEILQNNEQMILSISYEQKQDILEWEKLLKSVKQCDPEFLLMPKKYMISEQGLCGSSGVIKIVFDCFTFSFEEEIKNHAQKYKHFQQAEIWYLLFAIISSVKEMDRLSMKVGDIRPYNIFVNQNGQVKLSGVYSWPRQVQNFLKTSYDKTITYLAPEQLNQCRIGQKGKRSHIIGQSFSVGLTLLHACLLKPMDQLYNVKKFQFNIQKLDKQLNELRNMNFWNQQKQKNQKYSKQLINIIVGLLDLNQNKRITTIQLFDQLQPYAQEILNLREFEIPSFKVNKTPTKQQPINSNGNFQNSKKLSPQYSSIQKKQYNQPQSMGFDTLGFAIPAKFTPNYPINATRLTPQKSKKSHEKLQISLSNERKNRIVKTNQPQRQISKQRISSNHNNMTSIGRSGLYQPEIGYPSSVNFTGEFKISDGYHQSYRPSIGSTSNPIPQYGEKKFEVPITFNNNPSNYMSYQPKFQIPSITQYRTLTQPSTFNLNQVQTNYTYKTSVQKTQTNFVPSSINYPFSANVDLTKSQYKLIDNPKSFGVESLPKLNFGLNAQQSYIQANKYQTSTVHPILPGQTNFPTGLSVIPSINQNKNIVGEQSDLLKKIDEQLNKSKQMYPTSTVK